MQAGQKLAGLIIIATLARCLAACSVGLGNDEVYYLAYAQHLQWNYFDHPPLVALLIRLTTFNLLFTQDFFVRLGPIILAAINTILIYRVAKKIRDEKAGLIAALLFTASPYCSILAGIFILPDSPQLLFWISGVSLLIEIAAPDKNKPGINLKLILFGLTAGLCIMSKVHGVFLWFGLGVYILIFQRSLLRNPYLYLSLFITGLLVSPLIAWNFENNFITYRFHSDRVTIRNGFNVDSLVREITGSILYNNPLSWLLYVISLTGLLHKKISLAVPVKRILLLLSLPLILVLAFISCFRDTLPHWSGPAYIPLIIIAGCYLSSVGISRPQVATKLYRLILAACILITTGVVTGVALINFFPGTIGKKSPELLGDGDFTLDMYGWKDAKTSFGEIYEKNKRAGITPTSFVISNKWFPGAHIDHYIAAPLHLDFIALGDLNDIHTYAWLNQYRKKIAAGDDAYFITLSDNFCDPLSKYNGLFESIGKPRVITQWRGGKPARKIFIYLLKGFRGS